jgi:hypothetical protein
VFFYLLSLLTYESATGFIVLSFLLYRLAVPWRAAFSRWFVDIVSLGVLFGGFLIVNRVAGKHVNSAVPLSHLVERIAVFGYEAAGAIALSTFPAGPALVTKLVVAERTTALLALLMLLAGGCAWHRRRNTRGASADTGSWGWAIAAAIVALVVAYMPFVIASGTYHPLARGQGNRTNQLAAIPLLVIAYGLVSIGWRTLGRATFSRNRIYTAIPAVALIVASVITVRADIGRWQFTARRQRQLQATVRRALVGERKPFSIVVVGPLDLFSPGIPHPAAGEVIDLLGTFSVPLGRVLQAEYLVAPRTRFTCGTTTMFPASAPRFLSIYGQTLFLAPPAAHPSLIFDQQDCLQRLNGTS